MGWPSPEQLKALQEGQSGGGEMEPTKKRETKMSPALAAPYRSHAEILERCPACGGVEHSVTIIDSTYYSWGCNTPECLYEFSVHVDGAGKILGTDITYMPGEDGDGESSTSRFALIHRLGDAAHAGEAEAEAVLRAIPAQERDNYCRVALLRAEALRREADEMGTITQKDIDRGLKVVRQLKAENTPERQEEIMQEQREYMRQKRERERQEMARELADLAAKRKKS
jgi:hypothetical protein